MKNTIELYLGDCLEVMKNAPDNSVDAIITDPPYGLNFMNKKWDHDVPSVEVWKEVLRVLKPGGHLLSFGGTRTYHRLVVNIEDAGFEIRDQIQWLYGQGFPKSLDISKAIDKAAGAEREVVGLKKLNERDKKTYLPSGDCGGFNDTQYNPLGSMQVTAPHTAAAKQWSGWGTALKPANEPICLARKPLEKGFTVAANVQKWGTGGINIDGCRIEGGGDKGIWPITRRSDERGSMAGSMKAVETTTQGRFPANVLFDEEAAQILDEQTGELHPSRFFYCAKASTSERNAGLEDRATEKVNDGRETPIDNAFQRGETERKNIHPTVKPVKLMEYLCRLVTPPGGTVLDPFMGSGTTGIATKNEGFSFIGIEVNPEYLEIAKKRIGAADEEKAKLAG